MTRNAANEAQHGKAESASSVHALSITTDESLCPHLRALVSKVIVGINSARGLSLWIFESLLLCTCCLVIICLCTLKTARTKW